MMFFELRKCFFNRKSIILLTVAVVIKLVFSFFSIKNSDVIITSDEEYYMEQTNILRGSYNEENKAYITALYDQAAEANAEAALLPRKLWNGEITREEYESRSLSLNEILKHKDTIEELYRRYTYVGKQTDVRSFGYFDGWQKLFEDKSPDLLLIVILILFSLSAFQAEYEGGTVDLLLTCKNGKLKLAAVKIGCSMIVSTFCTLLFSLCQFTAVFYVFPVDNMLCNVQSIEAYCDYSKHISILLMCAILLLIRMMGSMMITALTCLFSQFSRKAVTVITASVMTVVLPIFLFDENTMYRLPLPISLLCGNGPVMPEESGLAVVIFQQMTQWEMLMMILAGATELLSIVLITTLIYCKKPFGR